MVKKDERKHFPAPFKNGYKQHPEWIDNLLQTKQITPTQFVVLGFLARKIFAHFSLMPLLKYRKTAQEINLHHTNVMRSTKELQRLNFIELQTEGNKTFYTLNWAPLWPHLSLAYKGKIRRILPKYADMFPETIKEREHKIARDKYVKRKFAVLKNVITKAPEGYEKRLTKYEKKYRERLLKEHSQKAKSGAHRTTSGAQHVGFIRKNGIN